MSDTEMQTVEAWVHRYQQKLDAGESLHQGDAARLLGLFECTPDLLELANIQFARAHLGPDEPAAELLRWRRYSQSLTGIITRIGHQAGVDMTPAIQAVETWENDNALDGAQIDAVQLAWMELASRLPDDPDAETISREELATAAKELLYLQQQLDAGAVAPPAADPVAPRRRDPLVTLLDDRTMKVLQVVQKHELDADTRLRLIATLDPRYWGKDSPELGALLNVDASRIRQTKWWRVDRKQQLADSELPTPEDI